MNLRIMIRREKRFSKNQRIKARKTFEFRSDRILHSTCAQHRNSAEIFLAGILQKLCSTFSIKFDIARFLQCQLQFRQFSAYFDKTSTEYSP